MIIYLLILISLIFPRNIFAQADYHIICPNDPNDSTNSGLTCYKDSGQEPFLNYTNIYPGFINNPGKQMTITNKDNDSPCFLTASSRRRSGDELLFTGDHRLNLSIFEGSTLWYSGPLEFVNQTLGKINPLTSATYSWTISLPQSADNDYQNLKSVFDLDLKFVCATNPNWQPPINNPTAGVTLSEFNAHGDEWVEIVNKNPYPVNLINWKIKDNPSNSNQPKIFNAYIDSNSYYVVEIGENYLNNSGGDYVVLISDIGTTIESVYYPDAEASNTWSKQPDGLWCKTSPTKGYANNPCLSTSTTTSPPGNTDTSSPSGPPTCNDAVPATPQNLTAIASGRYVTLSWSPVSQPVTSYLVAYGPSADRILYGNPNIGISSSYTVGGLTPGAQYCFYVRAQNGCMPGSPSNTVCVNSGSTVTPVETTPPTGFQPGVLGEQDITNPVNEEPQTIDVGNIQGVQTDVCAKHHIPLLFILALLINSLYFKDKNHTNLVLPFTISLFAFIIDWFILRKTCCLVPNWYCHYFWIGNILSFLVPKFTFKQSRQ